MGACLKCGDTGIDSNGDPCSCGAGNDIELPLILEIPEQYQHGLFDMSFLPGWLHGSYGNVLSGIITTVRTTLDYKLNVLICAPPNSGKTTFAYTVYKYMYNGQQSMPEVLDLNEVRKLLNDLYNRSDDYELLKRAKLAIIKIPMDVPTKFVEAMISILDLRSRNSGHTIFMYDGSKQDLINQDKYDKLQYIEGDGNYHTVKIFSYHKEKKEIIDE